MELESTTKALKAPRSDQLSYTGIAIDIWKFTDMLHLKGLFFARFSVYRRSRLINDLLILESIFRILRDHIVDCSEHIFKDFLL